MNVNKIDFTIKIAEQKDLTVLASLNYKIPKEILKVIFSFGDEDLVAEDLKDKKIDKVIAMKNHLHTLKLVCKFWNYAAEEAFIDWMNRNKFPLQRLGMQSESMALICAKKWGSNLEYLNLINLTSKKELPLTSIIKECPNLTEFHSSNLKNLEGLIDLKKCKRLKLEYGKLQEQWPDNLETLDLSHNASTKLQNLPSGLKRLILTDCADLEELPNPLPVDLKCLEISYCPKLTKIESLPTGLETLIVSSCFSFITLPKSLPEGLKELDLIYSSKLNDLPQLPKGIEKLALDATIILYSRDTTVKERVEKMNKLFPIGLKFLMISGSLIGGIVDALEILTKKRQNFNLVFGSIGVLRDLRKKRQIDLWGKASDFFEEAKPTNEESVVVVTKQF